MSLDPLLLNLLACPIDKQALLYLAEVALRDVLASHLADAHAPAGAPRRSFADQAAITPRGRAVREETAGSGEDAA